MNKYEFLYKLNQGMENSSAKERQEIAKYYDELIQDAIDNGENEADFIEKLGSIDKIIRTIRTDRDFVTNVKEKKDYQLKNVFSVSVKILGYLALGIIIFTLGTVGFSLVTSGGSMMIFSGIKLYYAVITGLSWGTILMHAGTISLGLGLLLIGLWIFKWLIRESRNQLEKLMEFISSKIKKEGE